MIIVKLRDKLVFYETKNILKIIVTFKLNLNKN